MRHLIGLGHREIGFISGPRGNYTTETRLKGVCDALEEAGLSLRSDWLLAGEFTLASGRAAGGTWLGLETRPTAVFCDSDEIACGFMGAVMRAGMTVPGDVSVVGFDDIEIGEHIHPALTTVHQPRRRIGTTVAEMMLQLIDGDGLDSQNVVLDVDLKVRDSSAGPPVRR